MRENIVQNFKLGIINALDADSIPDGAAADSKNWLTKGDMIELRRGFDVIGPTIAGVGRVTGIHTAYKADGTAVYFAARLMSVYYYVSATDTWVEIGTNILGAAASGEDVFFANYQTNAGAQMFFSSPNSGLFKVMVANPGDYTDMYSTAKNFKGLITIKQNRMWLWGRKEDKTGVYGSYIDTASYTTVTAEAAGSGNGILTTFTGTLAFRSGTTRTCFGVTFTDGTETFTDDYNGVLTGSAGGTGTINYTTGAFSITFAVAPVVGVDNVTSTYPWENSNSAGITDFTKSGTRTAGQGFIFRQDDGGGAMKRILTLGDTEYCFHEFKTWALTLTATDTNATNSLFRQSVGIPHSRAAVASSVGVFYIDVTDRGKPIFRKIYLNSTSQEVLPKTVTLNLDLTGYNFDDCAMEEWGDYIVFTGRTGDSTVNNRMFLFHKIWESIDIVDYYASCLTVGQGTLIAGESISYNVDTLFSGFDDDDSLIDNYWIGNISQLGVGDYQKKEKKLILEGNIQTNQSYDVYAQSDRGGFVNVGTVSGTGSYVDTSNPVPVGASTVGSQEVGGGGDGVEAFHYLTEIRLALDKCRVRQLKFVATGIGYASISRIIHHDVRLYANKLPSKYRS